MVYEIIISKKIIKKLDNFSEYKDKIKEILLELKYFPKLKSTIDIKKLRGFKNMYRIRIGKIRIIFSVDTRNKVIKIEDIDYRGNSYKKL